MNHQRNFPNLSRRQFLKAIGASTLAITAPSIFLDQIVFAQDQAERIWSITGDEVPTMAIFDNQMKSFMQERSIPGGALTITYESRLVFARGYNWNDDPNEVVQPDSLFRIASISKPFTATAIMQLVEQGEFALETPLVDILDLLPPEGRTPDPRLKDVLIIHLLQHLGGWDREIAFDPMFMDQRLVTVLRADFPVSNDDIITYMTGEPLQHDPGTTYAYSNYGYSLLGRVIEAVSGQTYEDYVKQHILAPLNITRMQLGHSTIEERVDGEVRYYNTVSNSRSVIDPTERVEFAYGGFNVENMDSHGGWLASAVDLVRFASAFDDPENCPLLSADSIEQMFARPVNDIEGTDGYYASGWGVGSIEDGTFSTSHSGGLPGTATILKREASGMNWAVLFNQSNDPSNLNYYSLSGSMDDLSKFVSEWSSDDLFPEFLDLS